MIDDISVEEFEELVESALESIPDEFARAIDNLAFFVEDEWKIGNSLTIRPGLRYEQETLSGTLVQNFSLKNNWAPRVGVAWDPSGSGKGKVFANYGRYYARVPSDLAARALSSDAAVTADYFDPNLTRPVPNGTVTTNAVTGASTVSIMAMNRLWASQ